MREESSAVLGEFEIGYQTVVLQPENSSKEYYRQLLYIVLY